MSLRLLVVADAHLGSIPGDVEVFRAFLEENLTGKTDLVLLGDLFDFWLGLESLQREHQRRVLAALDSHRSRGVCLRYVEGNRDYFISHAFHPRPFDEVAGDRLWLSAADVRVCFEHGDLINVQDRNYLRWRAFSRRPWIRHCVSVLPPTLVGRMSAVLERRFCSTNAAHRVVFPESLCRARASEVFASGAQRFFVGHFHRLWEWQEESGGRACRATVVPAWQQERVGWIYEPAAGIDKLSGPMRGKSTCP